MERNRRHAALPATAGLLLRRAIPLLGLLLCFCRSPFFPPTGTPPHTPPMRSTPAGVIKQLLLAYANRDYNLYQDLFPADGSFRFYVTPTWTSEITHVSLLSEPADPRLIYTGNYPYYSYWTQSTELASANGLFSNSTYIVVSPPTVDPGLFHYIIDSVSHDTTNVEVLMGEGELDVYLPDQEPIGIAIEKQVFLLSRDPNKLWVIKKWYDFGTQQ